MTVAYDSAIGYLDRGLALAQATSNTELPRSLMQPVRLLPECSTWQNALRKTAAMWWLPGILIILR